MQIHIPPRDKGRGVGFTPYSLDSVYRVMNTGVNKYRIDTIGVYRKLSGDTMIRKLTHLCRNGIHNNTLDILNVIDTMIDLKSNEHSISSSITPGIECDNVCNIYNRERVVDPSFNSLKSYFDRDGAPGLFDTHIKLSDHVINDYTTKIMFDNTNIIREVEHYEDFMNLPFYESVGVILGVICTSFSMVPFNLNIKISNKYGIKYDGLHPSSTTRSVVETCVRDSKKISDMLLVVFPKFKKICDDDNRDIHIFIAISYNDIVVHIKDMDYNMTYVYRLNSTDYFKINKMLYFLSGETLDEFWYNGVKSFPSLSYTVLMGASSDGGLPVEDFVHGVSNVYNDILE